MLWACLLRVLFSDCQNVIKVQYRKTRKSQCVLWRDCCYISDSQVGWRYPGLEELLIFLCAGTIVVSSLYLTRWLAKGVSWFAGWCLCKLLCLAGPKSWRARWWKAPQGSCMRMKDPPCLPLLFRHLGCLKVGGLYRYRWSFDLALKRSQGGVGNLCEEGRLGWTLSSSERQGWWVCLWTHHRYTWRDHI